MVRYMYFMGEGKGSSDTNRVKEILINLLSSPRRWLPRDVNDRGSEKVLQCYEKARWKTATETYSKATSKYEAYFENVAHLLVRSSLLVVLER
jgi:hypothetical protein